MQVRVFRSQSDFSDFDFEAFPSLGQIVRFADGCEFKVLRVGHIEELGRFVASIWLSDKPPYRYNLDSLT